MVHRPWPMALGGLNPEAIRRSHEGAVGGNRLSAVAGCGTLAAWPTVENKPFARSLPHREWYDRPTIA
jgi:hypothetical protein